MWFNKITGKVYIGSSIDGSKRLAGGEEGVKKAWAKIIFSLGRSKR